MLAVETRPAQEHSHVAERAQTVRTKHRVTTPLVLVGSRGWLDMEIFKRWAAGPGRSWICILSALTDLYRLIFIRPVWRFHRFTKVGLPALQSHARQLPGHSRATRPSLPGSRRDSGHRSQIRDDARRLDKRSVAECCPTVNMLKTLKNGRTDPGPTILAGAKVGRRHGRRLCREQKSDGPYILMLTLLNCRIASTRKRACGTCTY